jgi:hypothetical protein
VDFFTSLGKNRSKTKKIRDDPFAHFKYKLLNKYGTHLLFSKFGDGQSYIFYAEAAKTKSDLWGRGKC